MPCRSDFCYVINLRPARLTFNGNLVTFYLMHLCINENWMGSWHRLIFFLKKLLLNDANSYFGPDESIFYGGFKQTNVSKEIFSNFKMLTHDLHM